MKTEQILQLVEAVSGYGLDEFEYEENGVKLKLKKAAATSDSNGCHQINETVKSPIHSLSDPVAQVETKEISSCGENKVVRAPLVGVFYCSAEEGGEPFVKVGDAVKKGTVLAIVEAMKLMNEIESEYDGTIDEILVENGQAVEYNQPLFVLK